MKIQMRRVDRQVSREEAETFLDRAEYGFLSLFSDDEYPYGIPVNFVRDKSSIYIHCAQSGRKIDCLKKSPKASLCAIAAENVDASRFTTKYESAMVFGEISPVEDEGEKIESLKKLCARFCPDSADAFDEHIKKSLAITAVLKLKIEAITGKRRK